MRGHAPLPAPSGNGDSARDDGPGRDRRSPQPPTHPPAQRRARVALVERRMTRPPTPRAIHRPRLTAPLAATAGPPLVDAGRARRLRQDRRCCATGPTATSGRSPGSRSTREDNDPACLHASVALRRRARRAAPGTGRFVLVLDDLQALHAPAAHAALAALLDGLPPEVDAGARLADAGCRCRRAHARAGPRRRARRAGAGDGRRRGRGDARARRRGAPDDDVGAARQHRGLAGGARARGALGQPRGLRRRPTAWSPTTCATRSSRGLPPERLRFVARDVGARDAHRTAVRLGPAARRLGGRAGRSSAAQHGLLIALDRSDERFRHHRLVAEMLRGGAAAPRARPRGGAAPARQRLVPRRRRRRPRRAARDRRRRRRGGRRSWSGAARWPAVSRGDKRTAEAWQAPVHATPSAPRRRRSRSRRPAPSSCPARVISPSTGCTPRPPCPPVVRGRRGHPACCAPRSRATGSPACATDAESRLRPRAGGERRAARCAACWRAPPPSSPATTPTPTALLEEGAHRAAVSAPDVHALCLTQLALPALASRGLGGGRRARHAGARAGGATRPRRLSRHRARPRGVGARPRPPRARRGARSATSRDAVRACARS